MISFGCLIGRMMLSMSFADGFVHELLIAMLADKESTFSAVINDTLTYLRIAAQSTPSKSEFVLRPLLALRELISFQVPNTKNRPIATLAIERVDWLPTTFTDEKNKANEIVATCFLGPFIDLNIMDDKEMIAQYQDIAELGPQIRSQIATQLRTRFAAPRAEMFQIVETFLKNVPSRDAMINWLSQMAVMNIKRAGMHVVESEVASTSFILNILHVTHKLTSKIDVQKVDINYLFHPACRAKPGNETTILADTTQLETFLKDLNLSEKPKFPTECFWLTMLYHHIGLVPSMRKLTRIIKDLYQIVKELKRLRAAKPANEMEKKQQQVIQERYEQQARFYIQQVSSNKYFQVEKLLVLDRQW